MAECAQRAAQEITVDLTAVDYLSDSALATLVGLARTLRPPQMLCIPAKPALRLHLSLQARGWDGYDTLRLRCDGT